MTLRKLRKGMADVSRIKRSLRRSSSFWKMELIRTRTTMAGIAFRLLRTASRQGSVTALISLNSYWMQVATLIKLPEMSELLVI